MSPNCVLYIAIEKRINFTLEDLAPTSKAYAFLFSFPKVPPLSFGFSISYDFATSFFVGHGLQAKRIPLSSIAQCFEYERVDELELWHIVKTALE